MSRRSNISLPREKCMKCRTENDILMSSQGPSSRIINNYCSHKFCQSCFIKENKDLDSSTTYRFTCPLCHAPFYENLPSIDEAILIGEAANMFSHLLPHLQRTTDREIADEDKESIDELNILIIKKLESALQLNPTNFTNLYSLFISCSRGLEFLTNHILSDSHADFYRRKIYDYSYQLLDHPAISERYAILMPECFYQLSNIFHIYLNHPAAHKYAKLAYEHCLRSNHADLSLCKSVYLDSRALLAALPSLRFAVGDEVEFLHGLGAGSDWRLGKITELYYREREFVISFIAPYRVEYLDDFNSEKPLYAWVKADIDRYVRKMGVRSIENTRFQARLDAKVEELAQVFYSDAFIQDIYNTLAQDHEFVHMLQSMWQIELSKNTVLIYRAYVMYRQPMIHTDSGYQVPSCEEVIAGIRALFDPSYLCGGAASPGGETSELKWIRAEIMGLLLSDPTSSVDIIDYAESSDFQGRLLWSIKSYIAALTPQGSTEAIPESHIDLLGRNSDFTVPSAISEAISKVSTAPDIKSIYLDVLNSYPENTRLSHFLAACIGVHKCLEDLNSGPECECPFIYFFIKYCLDHSFGVPTLALALYDRMNMQLSREFIRCANPSCELNKLDKSTGKIKFKQCSRCKGVIYCSRECQVSHYPEHKALCMASIAV